jgi:hypothetical protein
MDKTIIRLLVTTVFLGLVAFTARAARAQTALEPTQIEIGSPAQLTLGGPVTVQAVLADSQGHPISKAVIYFTTQTKFLGDTSQVVLAQAVTNGNGQAVATFTDNLSGTVVIQAEFRGDAQYAPSHVALQPSVTGDQQVYSEHVGVDLPGFNVPPVGAPKAGLQSSPGVAGFIQSLWPAMNGWPVAAILLLVWSIYFFAVTFVFRVAALGNETGEAPSADPGRSL